MGRDRQGSQTLCSSVCMYRYFQLREGILEDLPRLLQHQPSHCIHMQPLEQSQCDKDDVGSLVRTHNMSEEFQY